ncbi:MAG: hypothetical protein HC866_18435 [Leptolyngbyaceae cyanobacterium RU_5_1]|nr:hypothetical protein [Leptolyngbyaceae cyanobacterium RU_5_1]
MIIDDYTEAEALTKKLEASLPITARPGKEYLKMMRDKGEAVSEHKELTIEKVFYSGDMGGIICAIAPDPEQKEVYAISITHLRIDPDHPLAAEVQAYQRKRVRGLKLQDSRSVMAELMQMKQADKKKRGKGFGKS